MSLFCGIPSVIAFFECFNHDGHHGESDVYGEFDLEAHSPQTLHLFDFARLSSKQPHNYNPNQYVSIKLPLSFKKI